MFKNYLKKTEKKYTKSHGAILEYEHICNHRGHCKKLGVVVNDITTIKMILNHVWPNAWSNSSALLQSNKT